jgi:hypothetical protein
MTLTRSLIITASVCSAFFGLTVGASTEPADPQFTVNYSMRPIARPAVERIVQDYVDDDDAPPAMNVAAFGNVDISVDLRRMVESMLQVSPTFRRQCTRLAAARNLTVSVVTIATEPSRSSQATTQFLVSDAGRLVARVLLGPLGDKEELLAHEFEHIVEQLDGVDLPAMSKRATTGVSIVDGSHFETVRAVAMGRQVAGEIRRAKRRNE